MNAGWVGFSLACRVDVDTGLYGNCNPRPQVRLLVSDQEHHDHTNADVLYRQGLQESKP